MRKLLIGSGIIISVATATSFALTQPVTTGADDVPPLVQTVQRHDEQLANHEARITNTENDVKDLQGNTNTPPSTQRVEVPIVVTEKAPVVSEPQAEPTPAEPVKVTNSTLQYGGEFNGYCAVTYSDGSKGNIKATITITDHGDGQKSSSDNCADFIGQPK